MRLANYDNTFIYIIKYLDPKISQYLTESSEALDFYYTVQDKRTGIKFSFAIIYIIIVTLLLFLSISIAIRFSSRFFLSINNLISASTNIGKGNLNSKVPEIKTDKELEVLNKNFNQMIDRLKYQQNKLIANERHEAWESVARKIAHEIKNPLTPIQLIIDSLKKKYSELFDEKNKESFSEKIKTINKQIKLIEKLVNEFSDFARMPKPILKENNLIQIIEENIKLLNELDNSISISVNSNQKEVFLNSDKEQLARVFFNLIKNSIESIQQKAQNSSNFDKIITIEIFERNNQIYIIIKDSGLGFENIKNNIKDILNPYFTTKKNGTGLGLSIVNKIINDHNGEINFVSIPNGAKIEIIFN